MKAREERGRGILHVRFSTHSSEFGPADISEAGSDDLLTLLHHSPSTQVSLDIDIYLCRTRIKNEKKKRVESWKRQKGRVLLNLESGGERKTLNFIP